MTKTKSTKRALLLSALSLLMCVSMLIGSTFAWFTDSVTSGNNIIKSGNLDIELEYWNGTEWKDVKGASDILTNTLWEPGVTDVAYLRVANAGSLVLKYQLGINILNEIAGKNQAGETFKLSDYIQFGVVEGVNGQTGAYSKDDAGRAAAIAAVTDAKKISAGYTKASTMEPADVLYLALVVYMPTDVDNVANHNGTDVPQIDLGINVYATQMTAENDSFNNQYDAAASWTGIIPEEIPESLVISVGEDAKDQKGTITVKSPEALVYLSALADSWVSEFSGGGTDVTSYRESNGGKGTDYYYHWQWTVELAADLDMSNIPMDSIDISFWGTFDGNGHTISNVVLKDGQDGLFNNGAKAINNLTVKNITVNAPAAQTVGAVAGNGNMTNVHVENATVVGGKYVGGLAGKGASFINCSIKNSTVTGSDKTVGGLVGYSIGDPNPATVTGNTVENVTVTGAYNVGGLLGQAQNETVENNTVKNVIVISTQALPADADDNEVRTAKVAARSNFVTTTIGTNTVDNCKVGCGVYGLALIPDGESSKIIVNDKEGFLNLTILFNDWATLFTDGNGTTVTNYVNGAGADYYYSGRWTVVLESDIDLNNATIAPVTIKHPVSAGALAFDGNNHTIKNAKIVTDATTQNAAGLFGESSVAFKNLKLDNIHVTGSNVGNSTAGVLAGDCNVAIDNITITNSSVTGGKYTGGVIGYGYTDVTNCTLTNVTVKGGYKLGGVIGYICASGSNTGEVTGNTLTDCTVDGIGGGVYAGGKDKYIVGMVVGNWNCNGTCNNNTITGMTTSATANIGEIEAGLTVTQ